MFFFDRVLQLRIASSFTRLAKNIDHRIEEHNVGSDRSTGLRNPIASEVCKPRLDAVRGEKYQKASRGFSLLKKFLKTTYIRTWTASYSNIFCRV